MKLMYYGLKPSGLEMSVEITSDGKPFANELGLIVPTSKKRGKAVGWGDVLLAVKKVLPHSPQMQEDLQAMLTELKHG